MSERRPMQYYAEQQAPELTLRTYLIRHWPTGQEVKIKANSPIDACEQFGWLPGECEVREGRQ